MDFITTEDGSKTLYNAQIGEHYHSTHGAQQESLHVFINTGLDYLLSRAAEENIPTEENKPAEVRILEVGFGTGLNFLNTAAYAKRRGVAINYLGIEAYPLSEALLQKSGYEAYVPSEIWGSFIGQYPTALQEATSVTAECQLRIIPQKVLDTVLSAPIDLIYFDAFAAIHQPEMWSEETLAHICAPLRAGGVFVTYAITGNLKRLMKSLGFAIQKVPGAPGKREMLRAIKL